MNSSFPIFTIGCMLAAAVACGQEQSTTTSRPVEGQKLVAEAATMLIELPQIEANIRQRVNLFGQQLSGAGVYAQWGQGSGKTKLELKISKNAVLQQICDGRFVYTRQELLNSKTQTFIDLRRVHDAIKEAGNSSAYTPTTSLMTPGGLPHLLRQLNDNFQFGAASASKIGDKKMPVWVIKGAWKTEQLTNLLPAQKDDILKGKPARLDQLPSHLPHNVVVTLGRDNVFPLFPYRIAFTRRVPAQEPASLSAPKLITQSLLTLELFQVRHRQDMTTSEFDYKPDSLEVVDQTDAYLKKLGVGQDDS